VEIVSRADLSYPVTPLLNQVICVPLPGVIPESLKQIATDDVLVQLVRSRQPDRDPANYFHDMSSPALDDYLRDRIDLINEDRALRTDCDITKHFSSAELQADQVVRAVRIQEAETIWGVEHDDVPHPFPGMEFLTGLHNFINFT
jgi:hypothetical protein